MSLNSITLTSSLSIILRVACFACAIFLAPSPFATETAENNWGYWLLVSLPADDIQSISTSESDQPSANAADRAVAQEKTTLESQRMANIKTAQHKSYAHLAKIQRLTVHGLDEQGTLIYRTSVRDPRVLRMETTDDDGNLVDHGMVRRGAAVVSVPVPEKDVVRLEIFFYPIGADRLKARSLPSLGQVILR